MIHDVLVAAVKRNTALVRQVTPNSRVVTLDGPTRVGSETVNGGRRATRR